MYETWEELFNDIFLKPENCLLKKQLSVEYSKYKVWPPQEDMFNAFKFCPFNKIKCIIIGEEPYNIPYSANGLAFSSRLRLPPDDLHVIFKEINRSIEGVEITSNNLQGWAEQGVLLLNLALTVREKEAVSHSVIWKMFTLHLIKSIAIRDSKLVWMLWGNRAQAYKQFLYKENHYVLTSDHPLQSIKGKGNFIGNDHFKLANEYLGEDKIDWSTYKVSPTTI